MIKRKFQKVFMFSKMFVFLSFVQIYKKFLFSNIIDRYNNFDFFLFLFKIAKQKRSWFLEIVQIKKCQKSLKMFKLSPNVQFFYKFVNKIGNVDVSKYTVTFFQKMNHVLF